MAYTIYGPFTNGSSPGITSTFLNGVENFLVLINSAATDSHITSDNSGNITAIGSITFNAANKQVIYRSAGGGSIIIDASDDKNIKINAGNVGGGGKVYLQVGGTNVMSVDGSGNVRALGTVTGSTTP